MYKEGRSGYVLGNMIKVNFNGRQGENNKKKNSKRTLTSFQIWLIYVFRIYAHRLLQEKLCVDDKTQVEQDMMIYLEIKQHNSTVQQKLMAFQLKINVEASTFVGHITLLIKNHDSKILINCWKKFKIFQICARNRYRFFNF